MSTYIDWVYEKYGKKLTNIYNLPDPFIRAVLNDPYDNQGSDFTPSSLSMPSRAYALAKLRPDDMETDISSCVDSFIGHAVHTSAELAARPDIDLCEKRFFAEFLYHERSYKISAQIDLYESDTKTLYDWKTAKAYAVSKKAKGGQKPDWIAQANIGAELLRRAGYEVNRLVNIVLVKDWNDLKKDGDDHPPCPVVAVEFPIWPQAKVIGYILTKMEAHLKALVELPKCPSSETWGGRRCARWCDASKICDQYQSALKTGILTTKRETNEIHTETTTSDAW